MVHCLKPHVSSIPGRQCWNYSRGFLFIFRSNKNAGRGYQARRSCRNQQIAGSVALTLLCPDGFCSFGQVSQAGDSNERFPNPSTWMVWQYDRMRKERLCKWNLFCKVTCNMPCECVCGEFSCYSPTPFHTGMRKQAANENRRCKVRKSENSASVIGRNIFDQLGYFEPWI